VKNKGLHAARLDAPGGPAERERAFAAMWQRSQQENEVLAHLFTQTAKPEEPGAFRTFGGLGPPWMKKPLGDVTERDEIVAATVMQWLGTNVGFWHLQRALEAAGYQLTQTRFR